MPNKILVITSKADVHCDYVAIKLRQKGYDIIRLNTEDMLLNTKYELTIDEKGVVSYHFYIKDADIHFEKNDFKVVWFRKPLPIDEIENCGEASIQNFIETEYREFLLSFYGICKSKTWVNPFWSNRIAGHKLPNLELAQSLGLNIPKTIITNNPETATRFAENCAWNILVKPFLFEGFNLNGDEYYSPFAKKVTKEAFLLNQGAIQFAPTFLQEYIEKSIELRVTVIGTKIFTAAIHSQTNPASIHDFRCGNAEQILHEPYQLPLDIEEKLLKFNDTYQLRFSTFDIILTPDGKFVFLECNPNGQWYWIEELAKLPMAEAMADLLIELHNKHPKVSPIERAFVS
jgi:RimK-like ATP-grasp domain